MSGNALWVAALYLLFMLGALSNEYRIQRLEKKMSRTRQELDAVIAALPASIESAVDEALSPIIQSLTDKLTQGADFTTEIEQLEGVGSEVANKVKADLSPKEA